MQFVALVLIVLMTAMFVRVIARSKDHKVAKQQRPTASTIASSTLRKQQRSSSATLLYEPIHTLLTDAEQSFYHTLHTAVANDTLICPQVRLANLVRPIKRSGRQNKYDFYRIQAKCVDFVLCNAFTTAPLLVVELDDASHKRSDRQARDAFVDDVLAQVGLPVLHVPWQRSYDAQQLGEAIRTKLNLPQQQHPTQAAAHDAPALASGWLTPIATAPRKAARPAIAAAPTSMHDFRYTCGQCQNEMPQNAKYCNRCGTALAA